MEAGRGQGILTECGMRSAELNKAVIPAKLLSGNLVLLLEKTISPIEPFGDDLGWKTRFMFILL
jgi:hypothetical protein